MSTTILASAWVTDYGYLAVLAGTYIEGEISYLSAIVAARLGHLNPLLVAAFAWLGGMGRDITLYTLARQGHRQDSLIQRIGPKRIDQMKSWLENRPFWLLALHRFLYGLSTAAVIAMGFVGMAWSTFLKLTCCACFLWVLGYGLIGYLLTGFVVEYVL